VIDETTCNDHMTDDRGGSAEDIFTSLHSGRHLQITLTPSNPVTNCWYFFQCFRLQKLD